MKKYQIFPRQRDSRYSISEIFGNCIGTNIKYLINKFGIESGQVVLLLVLVTVVGLTIGLSLISRTVTDVRMSSQIEQSGRAFTAAESGIETALKSINIGLVNPTGSVDISKDGSTAKYSVSTYGGGQTLYKSPLVEKNSSLTIWLVTHNEDRNLVIPSSPPIALGKGFNLCWGSEQGSEPAVELSLYYINGTDYKVAKLAYDNNYIANLNNFTPPDPADTYCGGGFRYRKGLKFSDFGLSNASDILLALRITPLYNNTRIGFDPDFPLPVQGEIITSVGQSTTGVARKIQVINGYKSLPSLLDFTLFAESEN